MNPRNVNNPRNGNNMHNASNMRNANNTRNAYNTRNANYQRNVNNSRNANSTHYVNNTHNANYQRNVNNSRNASNAARASGGAKAAAKPSFMAKKWQKIVVSLLLVVCLVASGAVSVYSAFMRKINFVDSPAVVTYSDFVSDSDDSDNVPEGVIVSTEDVSFYLLVGADSRYGLGSESRSDSMIIAVVDRTHKKIKFISLMRDMLLKLSGSGYNRLNVAYFNDSKNKDDSLTRTRRTIKDNFGIDIEKFVIIDFEGFAKMIDMMGGITIDVTSAEANYMCSHKKYGKFRRFSAGAGTYTMSGAEALNYARMREVGNSDFRRTERQRNMLVLMMEKMKGQSYVQLAKMVSEALGYVTTNVPEGEILGLAFEAPTLLNYEIVQYRLPINGSFDSRTVILNDSPSSTLWPNYTWNAKQLSKFIFEDDMTYADTEKWAYNIEIPELPESVKTTEDSDDTAATTTTTALPQKTTEASKEQDTVEEQDKHDFQPDTDDAA